jgi:acyl carrier protein
VSAVSPAERERVAEITTDIIAALAPKSVEQAAVSDELVRDLEYHSLALVELSFLLEDAFEFEDELDRDAVGQIVTVGDVIDYIVGEMEERGIVFHDSGEHAAAVVAEVKSWETG